MKNTKRNSAEVRRDRTGGIVRDKLDLLMDQTQREAVPEHLVTLAEKLQAAVDEKNSRPKA
jgi:hypothetical protein